MAEPDSCLLEISLHCSTTDSSLYAHHVFKAFDQDDKGTISFQVSRPHLAISNNNNNNNNNNNLYYLGYKK